MTLRVLQIVPSIALVYGGPSQMVRGFSAALGRAGAEVTVLTTDANGDAGQSPLDVPLQQPIPTDNYTVWYFPCAPWRRYKFSLPLLRWLARHGSEYDIAHIHALFSPVSTAAATVARWQGLPYLLRPLGTLDPADLQKKRLAKQIYGQLLEGPNLKQAAAIHFTSPPEAEVSQRFGSTAPAVVIPLGVTLPPALSPEALQQQLAALQVPTDRPIVLYLSRLDPKKGLDLLIPALERLLGTDDVPEFQFVLAGGNPQDPAYAQAVVDRIAASPLQRCTTCTGFVAGEAKTALLAAADLFVLPSYYDNFGIAVAEAMAAGTPVVISEGVYIWADIEMAEAGWRCDLSIDGIAATLATALQNPAERQRRGQQARHLATTAYSWDHVAQRTLATYRTIVTPQAQPAVGPP